MQNNDKHGYVISYINPDTDGVCSGIAYAFLKKTTDKREYKPLVIGEMNKETIFVLEHFRVCAPEAVSKVPEDGVLVIVDTHHREQLPTIRLDNVVEIIDHHPEGDRTSFPNAKFKNEAVGAVATLVTEMIQSASVVPEERIAGLLAAAIISNTLNFTAPSTCSRDIIAFKWLKSFVDFNDLLIGEMLRARSDIQKRNTEEVLLSDFKEFLIGGKRIGISQLEVSNIRAFVERNDFLTSLEGVKSKKGLDYYLFNGVDILLHESIVATKDKDTQALISRILKVKFERGLVKVARILLRKTDFIPGLKRELECTL